VNLHVEFMGLPGSGKSSLHQETLRAAARRNLPLLSLPEALAACLSRNPTDTMLRGLTGWMMSRLGRGVAVRAFARSTDRLNSLAGFLAENLGLAEIVFGSQSTRDISRDDRQLVIRWMLALFAGFQFVQERLTDKEVLIIDEGFCNRVTTLFAYSSYFPDLTKEIFDYLDRIPRPDLVFVLEDGVEVCELRLDRRGWTERLAPFTPHERRKVLTRSEGCIAIAASRLQQIGVNVVRLPNDRSVVTVVKTIQSILDSFEPTMGPRST
jgi:hypothetical protein